MNKHKELNTKQEYLGCEKEMYLLPLFLLDKSTNQSHGAVSSECVMMTLSHPYTLQI